MTVNSHVHLVYSIAILLRIKFEYLQNYELKFALRWSPSRLTSIQFSFNRRKLMNFSGFNQLKLLDPTLNDSETTQISQLKVCLELYVRMPSLFGRWRQRATEYLFRVRYTGMWWQLRRKIEISVATESELNRSLA